MGAESYGLVGFFSLLQSWLLLLDLGMSPTLSREISRFRGGALSAEHLLQIFGWFKKIFISLSFLSAVILIIFSSFIASRWLKTETLDPGVVRNAVILMALIVACRWVTGIYRAAVNGFEEMVWLSWFNSAFATLRFVVVFLVFIFIGVSPFIFFTYQLIISITELLIIGWYVERLMPVKNGPISGEFNAIKGILSFSLTVAFTSAVWIITTQTDKLILSKLMKLSEFGYYAMAVQVAGGITLVSGPVSAAILPRLTKLEAEGKHDELISLYRYATQLIVILAGTAALVLALFSKQVLFAWTGDMFLAGKVAPYLIPYTIGNFLLAIAAFPYYLQYAKGNLRLHLYGNIGFILFLIPTLIFVVFHYGGIGAGYVWISVNLLYLCIWIPVIHNRFVKGLNRKWYLQDILRITLIPLGVALMIKYFLPEAHNRIYALVELLITGILIVFAFAVSSSKGRSILLEIKKRITK